MKLLASKLSADRVAYSHFSHTTSHPKVTTCPKKWAVQILVSSNLHGPVFPMASMDDYSEPSEEEPYVSVLDCLSLSYLGAAC